MARTDTARAEHNRDRLRFPSDLTDREWAVVAPPIPPPRLGGRPRTTAMRDVMEAILFIASSGCPWRMLPGAFPSVSTVRSYFYAWRDSDLLARINQLLVMAAREIEGSSYRLRQHAALMPEQLRSKAAISPPMPGQAPRPRGGPPKNGHLSATA